MAILLMGACVAPAPPAAAPAAAPGLPLQDAVADMAPQAVWQNFYALTQVPRPSHHEEQVRAFLVDFGRDLGLETIVDPAGNVLIRKPAAPGLDDRPGVILQAHMDMVPQKTPDSAHDFLVDPIQAYVDAGWVTADGTTLGADDGIGMAMIMAVLQAQTPPLGPVEALFTVNEEDGMDGALGLQPDLLQGRILINLDSETEGEFTIGSAGGEYAAVDATYAQTPPQADGVAYAVTVSGLKGGHSGVDINRGAPRDEACWSASCRVPPILRTCRWRDSPAATRLTPSRARSDGTRCHPGGGAGVVPGCGGCIPGNRPRQSWPRWNRTSPSRPRRLICRLP
ncbi:MAG: M20/M25/M40 family metallo-hydrolase [Caldilineaceae bacterium]|nr:M20/M25/M40 family metallo-hydrolase [Caldilineaceae bacterium]